AQIFAVLGEPALRERLGLIGRTVLFKVGHHHPRAHRKGTVPGAVLGGEDGPFFFLGEFLAGVNHHAEWGGVARHIHLRKDDVGRRRLVLVFLGTNVAPTIVGEAEILSGFGGAIDFAGLLIVAHTVHL